MSVKYSHIDLVHLDKYNRTLFNIYASRWVEEDGQPVKLIETIGDFHPSFWIGADEKQPAEAYPANETGITFDGLPVQKVTLPQVHAKTFQAIRHRYTKTYEDDVPGVLRYLIDTKTKYSDKQRLCIFDIEVRQGEHSLDRDNPFDPIICIVAYDNFTDTFTTFAWRADMTDGTVHKKQGTYHIFSNERNMLVAFLSYLDQNKFDIFSGWNIERYDLPYLLNRLKLFGIEEERISYLRSVTFFKPNNDDDYYVIKIAGTDILDGLPLFKKIMLWKRLKSYSLNSVAGEMLGRSKVATGSDTREMWQNDFGGLLNYCLVDVDLVREILDSCNLIKHFQALQQVVPVPLEYCYHTSRLIDALLLHRYHGKLIFPSKRYHTRVQYQGAHVEDSTPGIYNNVLYIDFKSHYPAIILEHNVSPETKLSRNTFDKTKPGLLADIVKSLLVMRQKFKEKKKSLEVDSPEWSQANEFEIAYKVLANSIYGIFAFPSFRLYDPDIAAFVTRTGREMLQHLIKFFRRNNFKVIYGDTDSCFIFGGDRVREALRLLYFYNQTLRSVFKTYPPTVELEDLYSRMIFWHQKKRYVGIKLDGSIKSVGIDLVRSDFPQFFKTNLERLLYIVLSSPAKFSDLVRLMHFVATNITRQKPEDLASSKVWGQATYKVEPIQVRAAKYSNRKFRTTYEVHQKVPYIYVKDEELKAIALPSESTPLTIDYDTILEKFWYKKINSITEHLIKK